MNAAEFSEWYSEQKKLEKAPARGGLVSPISPYSARVPVNNQSAYSPHGPTIYEEMGRSQPNSWIDDVDTGLDFYSPMQPLWPAGPPNVNVPRDWDYPIGYNLNYIQPRMELMQMLRGMRASWGVLSTVVSTRQDQLMRIPWTIQRKERPQMKSAAVDQMKKFFKCPDGQHRYTQWAMLVLDDLLVLDAPTIYLMRDRAGRPLQARPMDGATIFPLIDDTGHRPESKVSFTDQGLTYLKRQPAFQQIIKGLPLVDLDESELMYVPMRPRPNIPMFGYPPTEQILVETSEAVRKTFYQLGFWAEGTIPDLIVTVPETWSPRQIAMFQGHFDAMLSGNLQLKSKVRFLPGGMKPFDVKNSSGDSLWSQRDETLIRLCCYAYSVSPTPFVKQVNRSVAQNAQESAEQEGLYPLMSYWKDNIMDVIIQEKFGFEDIEFIFLPRPERDTEKQATVLDMYVKRGIFSRNQALEQLGQEPIEGGDVHMIELGNAVIPVDLASQGLALPNLRSEQFPAPTDFPPGSGKKPNPSPNGSNKPTNNPQSGPSRPNFEAPVAKLFAGEVDDAARLASGDLSRNSYRRLTAGNYRKGHIKIGGLDISIENQLGSERGKRNPDDSVKWSNTQPAHYGYIKGTVGADGDQVDVFIGRRPDLLDRVFVIDQMKLSKKGNFKFDEHKIMLGYKNLKKALRDYDKAYGNMGRHLVGTVTELSFDELKNWLKSGDLTSPISGRAGNTTYRTDASPFAKGDTISTSTGFLNRSKRKKKTSDFLELCAL